MYRRLCRHALPLILAAIVMAACETPMNTIIEPPTPTIRTFSGTLTVNGGGTHRFLTTATGEIKVQLKALAPVDTVVVNLSLGVWTGASCNMIIENQNAVLNTVVVGTTAATGEFCARVYDLGRLTAPTEYTLEVSHF